MSLKSPRVVLVGDPLTIAILLEFARSARAIFSIAVRTKLMISGNPFDLNKSDNASGFFDREFSR